MTLSKVSHLQLKDKKVTVNRLEICILDVKNHKTVGISNLEEML